MMTCGRKREFRNSVNSGVNTQSRLFYKIRVPKLRALGPTRVRKGLRDVIVLQVRLETQVLDNQFGFIPRITMEAVYLFRDQQQVKGKPKDLNLVLLDSEKAQMRVPEISCRLQKRKRSQQIYWSDARHV